VAKEWQFQKRQLSRKSLREIQIELDKIKVSMDVNKPSFEMRCWIKELQRKKQKFLEQEEACWRLKSRAT